MGQEFLSFRYPGNRVYEAYKWTCLHSKWSEGCYGVLYDFFETMSCCEG